MRAFHFTTVVSSDYIYKFLAMQESISYCCKNYHLFALCVDKAVYKILRKLPLMNTTLLYVNDLENEDLKTAKLDRCFHEYCWTLKPFILNYVMKAFSNARHFAHLDSDLFFYSSLDPIFEEAPNASLYLTDHNNSERFMHTYRTSGRFNSGFVCCKNDAIANEAVEWWQAKCIAKCPMTANADLEVFGDQKYVEKWPDLFPNVRIVYTKGANVAQWNIEGFHVSSKNDIVYVNQDRLIFYHFSGLSILDKREFNLSTFNRIEENALKMIYMPYIKNLSRQIEMVTKRFPDFLDGIADRRFIGNVHNEKL